MRIKTILLLAVVLSTGLFGCQAQEAVGESPQDWKKVPKPADYGPPSHAGQAGGPPEQAPTSNP